MLFLFFKTLKAVGKDERLFEELANLIRLQKNIEEKRRRIELDQMTLESDKAQNKKLQVRRKRKRRWRKLLTFLNIKAEINRYHERLKHLMIVKLCDAKKPVIELQEVLFLFIYFIYSFIHLFIYSFIHLFIYSFIHLFIYF